MSVERYRALSGRLPWPCSDARAMLPYTGSAATRATPPASVRRGTLDVAQGGSCGVDEALARIVTAKRQGTRAMSGTPFNWTVVWQDRGGGSDLKGSSSPPITRGGTRTPPVKTTGIKQRCA